MTDQNIIYLLVAISCAGTVLTQIRRRTLPVPAWLKENWLGLTAGAVSALTMMLIGPGDGVDLGTYMARTWAAGIGPLCMYVIGGNVTTGASHQRRAQARKTAQKP